MKDWYIFLQYCETEGLNPGIISFWRSFKSFSRQDKIGFVLILILVFLTMGLLILDIYLSSSTAYFLIPLTLLCIVFWGVIKSTKIDPHNLLKKRTDQQKETLNLLKENGLKDKNQIKQLHNRLLNRLMDYERNNGNTMKKSSVLLTVFIIPFSLLLVSEIISRPISSDDMIIYCFFVFFFCFVLYISIYGFLWLICVVDSNRYNNLRKFIEVLRDILDSEFPIENEDILEVHYYKP